MDTYNLPEIQNVSDRRVKINSDKDTLTMSLTDLYAYFKKTPTPKKIERYDKQAARATVIGK